MSIESKRPDKVFLLLLFGWFLTGCEHLALEDPLPPAEATLSAVQVQIFNQGCALSGCHAGSGAALGLSLVDGESHENLVGVPSSQVPSRLLVAPGNPDDSYLVTKVEGGEGMVGALMPLGRPPLTDAEVQLIREWVAVGAPDN